MAERPVLPKAKLFTNGKYLSLVWDEGRSSLKERDVRAREAVPPVAGDEHAHVAGAGQSQEFAHRQGRLRARGGAIGGGSYLHVLDYSSPGATGAPVFSAHVVRRLRERGPLDGFKEKRGGTTLWDYGSTEIEQTAHG